MTPAFVMLDQLGDEFWCDALNPTLSPEVWVEPKDRLGGTELSRQGPWVSDMGRYGKRCLVFAIPNGTNIATKAGRGKVKREGLYTGFPDNGIAWTGFVAFAEWKSGTGDPSDAQIECLNRLVAMGHPCAILRTSAGGFRWLRSIGAPVSARVLG